MCRISTISEDWAIKGFHIHVGNVELVMRPDHRGGIVFKKWFTTTTENEEAAAIKAALPLLDDPAWRRRFLRTLDHGRVYLLGVDGVHRMRARARTLEFKYLRIALERWETG